MANKDTRGKIVSENIFNCANLDEFVSSIIQILPFEGASMSKFYLCEIDGIQFLTKLCFYRKAIHELHDKQPADMLSTVDAEIQILNIFNKKITRANITPCILELVYYKICDNLCKIIPSGEDCDQLLMLERTGNTIDDDLYQTMCKYSDMVKNGLAYNKCAFLVLDKCDMSLDEYLQKSVESPVFVSVFKSILFLVVHTFYAISELYPGFRHYDLHTENVMLKFDTKYKFKANKPKFMVFIINGEQYAVPYFGIIPKIIDFGFSSLPEENVISNFTGHRIHMYFRSNNDLLLLFHWIHSRVSHIGGDKPAMIDELLQHLEPNRAYVQYHTPYIRKVEDKIPTYREMVTNSLWDEYKNIIVPDGQIYNEYAPVNARSKSKK